MPSNFLTGRVRGSGTTDPVPGRMIGMKTFLPLGNVTPGAPGLEDDPVTNSIVCDNRFAQVGDRVFHWHKDSIYLLDPTTGDWVDQLVVVPVNATDNQAQHGGLRFWQDVASGDFGLVGTFRNTTNNFGGLKYTYQTDTWADFNSAAAASAASVWRTVQFRNAIYSWHQASGVRFFDPVTESFGLVTTSQTNFGVNTPLAVANNNLYMVTISDLVSAPAVLQLVGGAMLPIVAFATPADFSDDGTWFNSGKGVAYYDEPSNSLVTIYLHENVTLSNRFAAVAIDLGTLAETDVSAAILPSYLITPGDLGPLNSYTLNRFFTTVDQEDILGSPRRYVMWAAGLGTDSALNIFEAVGIASQWVDLGASQMSLLFSIPSGDLGGSTNIYNENDLWGCISRLVPAPNGVDLTLTLTGDSVKVKHGTVTAGPFVRGEVITGSVSTATGIVVEAWAGELWLRNVSGGPFDGDETLTGGTSGATATSDTLLAHGAVTDGPFVLGETVTGGTSTATGVVTQVEDTFILVDTVAGGPFQNAEVLTGGTSTATATTSAAPTGQRGGTADKIGRLRFSVKEVTANTVATIAAPAGGLTAPMTINVNDFETVIMDGREYALKHETVADLIPNAAPISYTLEFQRP